MSHSNRLFFSITCAVFLFGCKTVFEVGTIHCEKNADCPSGLMCDEQLCVLVPSSDMASTDLSHVGSGDLGGNQATLCETAGGQCDGDCPSSQTGTEAESLSCGTAGGDHAPVCCLACGCGPGVVCGPNQVCVTPCTTLPPCMSTEGGMCPLGASLQSCLDSMGATIVDCATTPQPVPFCVAAAPSCTPSAATDPCMASTTGVDLCAPASTSGQLACTCG